MALVLPQVIAHRGASACCPENTLIAFQRAADLGAKCIEFDVMLSADHQPVVIHDRNLSRTTCSKGCVDKLSLKELTMLDAGKWFSQRYACQPIPTLHQVLCVAIRNAMSVNIEIKPANESVAAVTTEVILQTLIEHWPKEAISPLISSFSETAMQQALNIAPAYPRGYLMHRWREDWLLQCDKLACETIHVNELLLTRERIQQLKASGRLVLAYTVNELFRAIDLFSFGIDGIFSDHPDLLEQSLELI